MGRKTIDKDTICQSGLNIELCEDQIQFHNSISEIPQCQYYSLNVIIYVFTIVYLIFILVVIIQIAVQFSGQ